MQFSKILKSTLFSLGVAFAASSATAATVASVEVTNGAVVFGTGAAVGNPDDVEALAVTGEFEAFLDLGFDPDSLGDYTLAADLTVNGFEVFNESITLFTTGTDLLLDALDIAATIEAFVPGLLGNVIDEAIDGNLDQTEIFPDIWLGLDFNLTDADFLDGTLAGSFAAVLSEEELVDPGSVFSFDADGTFSGSASISFDGDPSVVPLPASAPLLLAGLFGMVALRRRSAA